MNDLIRPALYGAKHQIYPLLKNSSTIKKNTEFVGPVCESSDFQFQEGRVSPNVPFFYEGPISDLMILNTEVIARSSIRLITSSLMGRKSR